MELTYTQNLEDFHLWQALGPKTSGFYIDVGAGHPIADNVSFWFYERGWRGICVEPQPDLVAAYGYIRPRDTVFAGLVGRQSGEVDFHMVDRLHGFSTTVEKHAQGAGQFGADYKTVRMPIVTMAELCERNGVTEIDFLKIDVEGAEADVLMGNDWKKYRPKVIVAEAILPGSGEPAWGEWEPYVLAQGYEFTLFDTLNRFYVAIEATDVLARAPRVRGDWDAIKHLYQIGRAPECADHPEHALAKEFARGLWASLPGMDRMQLAGLLGRARGITDAAEIANLAIGMDSDAFRAQMGRIACGYDGGQIFDD
jgi:FkbM family methyltransferase